MSRPPGPPCTICGGKYLAKGLCAHHYAQQYRAANHDRLIAHQRAYVAANHDAVRASEKRTRAAAIDVYRARDRERTRANAVANREKARAWAAANPERRRERARIDGRRRKSGIGHATPPWADRKAIARIYETCANMSVASGVAFEVDHFIPLHHPLVCGLHVEANLAILTATANRAKGNHFDPGG